MGREAGTDCPNHRDFFVFLLKTQRLSPCEWVSGNENDPNSTESLERAAIFQP